MASAQTYICIGPASGPPDSFRGDQQLRRESTVIAPDNLIGRSRVVVAHSRRNEAGVQTSGNNTGCVGTRHLRDLTDSIGLSCPESEGYQANESMIRTAGRVPDSTEDMAWQSLSLMFDPACFLAMTHDALGS